MANKVLLLSLALSLMTCADAKTVTVSGATCSGDVASCPDGTWNTGLSVHKLLLQPGDQVVFTWSGQTHGLVELPSKAALDACAVGSPKTVLRAPTDNGRVSITVGPVGESRYFACPVSGHCSFGMSTEIASVASAPACSPPKPRRVCTRTRKGKRCHCVKRRSGGGGGGGW